MDLVCIFKTDLGGGPNTVFMHLPMILDFENLFLIFTVGFLFVLR